MSNEKLNYDEKIIVPRSGFVMLAVAAASAAIAIALIFLGAHLVDSGIGAGIALLILPPIYIGVVLPLLCMGFKIIAPNEAAVLVLFGKYVGSIVNDGFYYVNPFCRSYNPAAQRVSTGTNASNLKNSEEYAFVISARKLSLKAMTLNNAKQKVNDEDGNPIEIGVVVIWRIVNTAKACFNVDNYAEFVSTQADSAIRNVARRYPYDVSADGDEKSLRGSSQEIAETLRSELQERVFVAGIEIVEARISHLAYAPEIAAAMLQRQQASAIIAARQKIVEGAVGMVEMALNMMSEKNIVKLDDERRATMVSNLLVVLCGNKDAQPVVNSGSIY
ncbi:MAG: SPFH domain-containing protein [Clostridiales bacterium]|jgi:regulator of protease activity HflC (stomatin/prohibitin superfamily)|nr:SPFH domain-containing protein [Clostridiales bacterium]